MQSELEQLRTADIKLIKKEIDRASKVLGQSRGVLDFTTNLLRDTGRRRPPAPRTRRLAPAKAEDGIAAFTLPALPDTWAETLDSLRPPRSRDKSLWDWRRRPPQAVVFDPPSSMRSPRVHLHLHHPLVRRLLDGFLAHGFGEHDLQRVTVVRDRKAGQVRVLAFGRLSLFGRGAARLHDTLVPVVALWDADTGPQLGAGEPIEDARALDRLEQLFGDPASLRPDRPRPPAGHPAPHHQRLRHPLALRARRGRRPRPQRRAQAATARPNRGRSAPQVVEDQRASIDRTLFAQLDLVGFRDERDQGRAGPPAHAPPPRRHPPRARTRSPPTCNLSTTFACAASSRSVSFISGRRRWHDQLTRNFHETWIGLVQPSAGLVVSTPS